MSRFDDFVERLEAAFEGREGHDSFLEYLQGTRPGERAELLGETERRDPEGVAGLARGALDRPEAGGVIREVGERQSWRVECYALLVIETPSQLR